MENPAVTYFTRILSSTASFTFPYIISITYTASLALPPLLSILSLEQLSSAKLNIYRMFSYIMHQPLCSI